MFTKFLTPDLTSKDFYMAYSVHQHLLYNAWANKKFADLLHGVDDKIIYKQTSNSFSSIAKTWLHIWDAEIIWMNRFHGISLSDWPSSKFTGNREDMLNGLVNSSESLRDFIKVQPESFLTSPFTYENLKGETVTDPIENVLFHLVNHATYHRGQIITMLRDAGIKDLVSTDLIHYLRSLK
jgi:uncharacterized damage-inducible protein DinB